MRLGGLTLTLGDTGEGGWEANARAGVGGSWGWRGNQWMELDVEPPK
jgi:hypothetical protein